MVFQNVEAVRLGAGVRGRNGLNAGVKRDDRGHHRFDRDIPSNFYMIDWVETFQSISPENLLAGLDKDMVWYIYGRFNV